MTETRITSRHAIAPEQARAMDTAALRAGFLVEDLFEPGVIALTYTHYDRMIIGSALPLDAPLQLGPVKLTGTPGFLDRREMIVVNIGGHGSVSTGADNRATIPAQAVNTLRQMLYCMLQKQTAVIPSG